VHPNPAFRNESRDRHLAFARDRGFGTLAVNAPDGPLLSHVPFLLDAGGATADLHLVRSNPIARLADGPVVIAVQGPDGYVSPDWYEVADQVPTWNYVAVPLRGHLERLPDSAMRDMLERQSAAFEARLAPKPAWTLDKMSEPALARMMRQIVPFRLRIDSVDGTWKLNQNKDEAARLRAAGRIASSGFGQELATLAALMGRPEG
jgi:transcriptional regulator